VSKFLRFRWSVLEIYFSDSLYEDICLLLTFVSFQTRYISKAKYLNRRFFIVLAYSILIQITSLNFPCYFLQKKLLWQKIALLILESESKNVSARNELINCTRNNKDLIQNVLS